MLRGRGHDDSVDQTLAQGHAGRTLAVVLGIPHHHAQILTVQGGADLLQQRRVQRVGKSRHDHADRAAARGLHRSRHQVRLVIDLGQRLPNTLAGVAAHPRVPVQHPRHRCLRHAGQSGDFPACRCRWTQSGHGWQCGWRICSVYVFIPDSRRRIVLEGTVKAD